MSDNFLTWIDSLQPGTLLKPNVVAKKLNISITTTYNLLNRGDLKGFKIGKSWRIDPVDLKEYIQQSYGGKTNV